MALDLSKFIERFIGEARDHLTRLETGLTALEAAPDDPESVNALFRSAHTIKGSARMLKLSGVCETAHRMEDLLGALRAGAYRPEPTGIALLLRGVDALAAQLERVEEDGGDPPADPVLCAALTRMAAGGPATEAGVGEVLMPEPTPQPALVESAAPAPPSARMDPPPLPARSGAASRAAGSVRVPLARLDELIRLIGEANRVQAKARRRLREAQALDRAQAHERATTVASGADQQQALHQLVLGLRDDLQAQEQLAAALNERALRLRMLALATVFDPAARMVREFARAGGKEVRCVVQGGEIELDRQVIEGLGAVLLHVLRNAVDHGLEDPAGRRAAGKPGLGQISIAARQIGGGVEVEVSDDGRGLNRERIIARAVRQGLVESARAVTLTDDQVWDLIYAPGLSTSEIITDLSGRGVGMDVVKRTIAEDLHGAVSLTSRPGAGTTFTFRLPLSLAVMRVLLCESAGQCFGLAAQQVVELIRVGPGETVTLAGRPAVVLRNEFVPLIPLAELLGLPTSGRGAAGAALAVVIGVRQAKLGLLVDRLVDTQAMVIKPLPEHLRAVRAGAGAGSGGGLVAGLVVTDDDALVSVLQAPALLDAARRARGEGRVAAAARDPAQRAEPWHVLVVDDSLNTRAIVKEVLEAYGYRVTTAEDGLQGWQKALGRRFDAVLTDVEMPGLDGFALTARLRANAQYEATPIVIITSRETEVDKRRGVQVGADAYIVKGDFDQSGLLDTLRNLLGDMRG
ncbi:response regulator [uncultured Thiodictyon sp.]|uniref:hybrid sensor histidine kinase/response regulator n=1 Tax=uncultured Thiodictyon sp. TaxID=1846217 RepID=UPI0025DD2591|nr:response regulator [uncultured Thiodictyon sp.]